METFVSLPLLDALCVRESFELYTTIDDYAKSVRPSTLSDKAAARMLEMVKSVKGFVARIKGADRIPMSQNEAHNFVTIHSLMYVALEQTMNYKEKGNLNRVHADQIIGRSNPIACTLIDLLQLNEQK